MSSIKKSSATTLNEKTRLFFSNFTSVFQDITIFPNYLLQKHQIEKNQQVEWMYKLGSPPPSPNAGKLTFAKEICKEKTKKIRKRMKYFNEIHLFFKC